MTLRVASSPALGIQGLASKRSSSKPPREFCLRAGQGFSSAPPRAERQLPRSRQPFRLKKWQRNLGIGTLGGVTAYVVYNLYSDKQSRDAFIPYKLVKKDPVSSTASIFVLQPQDSSRNLDRYHEAWQQGIWNVHFKQPQLQIVRAYTPLPPQDTQSEDDIGQLRFLIRNDMYGEVSSYLHKLPIGSLIELRGPNLEYTLSPDVKQVVFFAGGTGIAPALQVAHALFRSNEHGKGRKLHILWANRKREDCLGGHSDESPAEPLAAMSKSTSIFSASKSSPKMIPTDRKGMIVEELEQLKRRYPGQVTVEYFVNEENTWLNKDAVVKALGQFDDKDFSLGSSTLQEQRQILISGPTGFISYLAGPKEWRGGREQQGPVSKIIAHAISLKPHNVKVWKI